MLEGLLEFLLEIIMEPVVTIIVGAPIELAGESIKELERRRLPKWAIVIILTLYVIAFFAIIAAVIGGAILISKAQNLAERNWGIVLLAAGAALIIGYITLICVRHARLKSKAAAAAPPTQSEPSEKTDETVEIGQTVNVTVDRPLGSIDPIHGYTHELNYGFAPDYKHNREYPTAYVLGVEKPIKKFTGILIAVIHRHGGSVVWVTAPKDYDFSNEEIISQTEYQEKYHVGTLIR